MSQTSQTITLTLSEEELALVEALAKERGLDTAADGLHVLIQDAVEFYDALWDKKFAETPEVLAMLAREARAEYEAGLTEDFDPDNDPDAP